MTAFAPPPPRGGRSGAGEGVSTSQRKGVRSGVTDALDQLAAYDPTCLVDRAAGELTARCDSEPMNLLVLNLVNEILTGRRSVAEAREAHVENAAAYLAGRSTRYTKQIQFPRP